MIVRIDKDTNKIYIVNLENINEDEFLELNKNSNFIKVDSLPESRYNQYIYNPDTNTIEVDTEKEIELYKEELLSYLDDMTKEYILSYYPPEKQNADNQQKDYFGTALLMIRNNDNDENTENLTVDQIYIMVGNFANRILDGEDTLDNIISQFPDTEKYYWEQLIKAAARKAWVIRCVYVFNEIKTQILNATTLDELDEIHTNIQVIDFPVFPQF